MYITRKQFENMCKGSSEWRSNQLDAVLGESYQRVATFGDYVIALFEDREFRRLKVENGEIVSEEPYKVNLVESIDEHAEARDLVRDMLDNKVVDLTECMDKPEIKNMMDRIQYQIKRLGYMIDDLGGAPNARYLQSEIRELRGMVDGLKAKMR